MPANELDGWMVMKARKHDPDALRKAQGMTLGDALTVIVDRSARRAIAKVRFAEITGTNAYITEVERLSAALVLKGRHAERHETSGRFVKTTPSPEPDPDQFGGAPTNQIESGTGNPVDAPPNPAFPLWNHLGASLIG